MLINLGEAGQLIVTVIEQHAEDKIVGANIRLVPVPDSIQLTFGVSFLLPLNDDNLKKVEEIKKLKQKSYYLLMHIPYWGDQTYRDVSLTKSEVDKSEDIILLEFSGCWNNLQK